MSNLAPGHPDTISSATPLSADVRPVSPARGPETVRRDEPVCAVFGVGAINTADAVTAWMRARAQHVRAEQSRA